jgi:hypothetical protein
MNNPVETDPAQTAGQYTWENKAYRYSGSPRSMDMSVVGPSW